MKVLHIVTDIRIANGIMSVVLNYAKFMPEDIKFDVMYFKEFEGNRKKDIESLGGMVYNINKPGLKSFFKCDIDEFLSKHKDEYSAVHIHAPHLALMLVPKFRKFGINNIAVHCHSTWYSLFAKNKLRNHLLSIPVKYMKLQRFACGSKAGEFWYGKNNFKVLPNAVNCELFRYNEKLRNEKRKELGYEGNFIVGHLGRVKPPQKNHPFLIEVFAEICKIKENSKLILIGAEKDEELVALAEKFGVLNKIEFVGQRVDVAELLCTMDVFVFPSFYEGLPVSVVEAEAVGLPVVMADTITDEVCCTNKITRMPLNSGAKKWALKALEYSKLGIGDTYEEMKKSGWSIDDCAKTLEEFYRRGVIDNG